jgi:hypothetical protein
MQIPVKYTCTLIGKKVLSGTISVSDKFLKLKDSLSEIKAEDVIREYLEKQYGKATADKVVDLKVEVQHGDRPKP